MPPPPGPPPPPESKNGKMPGPDIRVAAVCILLDADG